MTEVPSIKCLWAARDDYGHIVYPDYADDHRAEAVRLLTRVWAPQASAEACARFALLTREVPGGEWREVPRSDWAVA